MKFREFHSFLTKWNIPLDTYVITEELLETELWIHESRNAAGDVLAMSITIAGDPPKGSWFIRFDGAHGIVWDGQIIPVYGEDGSSNPMFEALLQSTGDLRISLALEKAEKDIGGDLETLKRFQQHIAEEITDKEALLLLETSNDTSDSTVEDTEAESTGESADTESTTEAESTTDSTTETAGDTTAESGPETSDGSEISVESGSEETSTDGDGSTVEGSTEGDSESGGLPDSTAESTSTDDGTDTSTTDGSTTDDTTTAT